MSFCFENVQNLIEVLKLQKKIEGKSFVITDNRISIGGVKYSLIRAESLP